MVVLNGMEQEYLKSILGNLNIDYAVVDPSNVDELYPTIEKIGDLTGRSRQAKALIKDIKAIVAKIKRSVAKVPKDKLPRVYLEIWHDPVMSV